MRSAFVALALFCLALIQTSCAGDKNSANGANTDDANQTRAAKTTLPPLPADADARAYFERGREAYTKDLDDEAVAAFEQVVRLEPEFAEGHYHLGLAYAAVGRNEDAERSLETAAKLFREAVEREPTDAEAHFQLGRTYAKLGKHAEAVRAFRQSVRLAPDSEKYYELGYSHAKLAQYGEAVAAYQKAVELDPDNYRALEELDEARAGLERRKDFLKQQERVRQRANANAAANTAP